MQLFTVGINHTTTGLQIRQLRGANKVQVGKVEVTPSDIALRGGVHIPVHVNLLASLKDSSVVERASLRFRQSPTPHGKKAPAQAPANLPPLLELENQRDIEGRTRILALIAPTAPCGTSLTLQVENEDNIIAWAQVEEPKNPRNRNQVCGTRQEILVVLNTGDVVAAHFQTVDGEGIESLYLWHTGEGLTEWQTEEAYNQALTAQDATVEAQAETVTTQEPVVDAQVETATTQVHIICVPGDELNAESVAGLPEHARAQTQDVTGLVEEATGVVKAAIADAFEAGAVPVVAAEDSSPSFISQIVKDENAPVTTVKWGLTDPLEEMALEESRGTRTPPAKKKAKGKKKARGADVTAAQLADPVDPKDLAALLGKFSGTRVQGGGL